MPGVYIGLDSGATGTSRTPSTRSCFLHFFKAIMKLIAPFVFLAGLVAASVAQDDFTVSVYVRG